MLVFKKGDPFCKESPLSNCVTAFATLFQCFHGFLHDDRVTADILGNSGLNLSRTLQGV